MGEGGFWTGGVSRGCWRGCCSGRAWVGKGKVDWEGGWRVVIGFVERGGLVVVLDGVRATFVELRSMGKEEEGKK